MTDQEKQEIKDKILKNVKYSGGREGSGGQQINSINTTCRLRSEDVDFDLSINMGSQLKNRKLCYLLFELYLDELLN